MIPHDIVTEADPSFNAALTPAIASLPEFADPSVAACRGAETASSVNAIA
jgi:hypothetical protein